MASDAPAAGGAEVRRLHPLSPFYRLAIYVARNAFPVVALALTSGRLLGAFLAIPLIIGSVRGFIAWARFTYVIEGGELRIDEGVFTRRSRVVPIDRVQQVEIHQSLRHRLFKVAVVRADTGAEGAAAEVSLSVVSLDEAARLRAELLGDRAPVGDDAVPHDDTVVRLSAARLALAGVTGPQLPLMFAIVAWAGRWFDDAVRYWRDDIPLERFVRGDLAFAAVMGVALVVLWLGLAAAAAIVADNGYTLRRDGDSIRVRRGLFERREAVLSPRRVQALHIDQTILRRPLRLASLRVQSAGRSAGKKGVARLTVPIVSTAELEKVVPALLPDVGPLPALLAAPPAARRRAIVRRVAPVLLVPVLIAPFSLVLGAVALLAIPLAALAGDLAYRGLGHGVSSTLIVARTGGLLRSTTVVPLAKAQSVSLSTSPMQRRLGLATLAIHVAGKGASPKIVDAEAGRLTELVSKLSAAAGDDEAALRHRPSAPTSTVDAVVAMA